MKCSKFIKLTSIAVLLVAATNATAAGPTATLQVKGTITPGACTPSLANGGIVDFGATASSEITGDKLALTPKVVQLRVDCSGAMKISFNAVDNRAGTAVSGISNFPAGLADFGLGKTTDDQKMGTYVIYPTNAMIDGVGGDVLGSSDLATWHKVGVEVINTSTSGGADSYISVASTESIIPEAFTNMTMDLGVFPFLDAEMKNITELQELDGNVTFNFDYM